MKTSLKIAALYALSGILWILASDKLLLMIVGDNRLLEVSYLQTFKGIFYVSFTAILLYFLVYSYHRRLNDKIRSLEQLNQRLSQSNYELEQYAYIASHDLQEPLRVTSSLLQRLQLRYADQLDEKGNQYINLAINNASRMRKFVQDLLNFSKVGSDTGTKTSIRIREIIREIEMDLEEAIRQNNATITLSGETNITGESMQLKQVLSNLISNAIKYRRPEINPVIGIRVGEHHKHWSIEVTDNGVGIDPQFHERIFGLFQRLHAAGEHSGTGIGLTIARKIVEKCGGQIGLRSESGKGSTFFFTLPK